MLIATIDSCSHLQFRLHVIRKLHNHIFNQHLLKYVLDIMGFGQVSFIHICGFVSWFVLIYTHEKPLFRKFIGITQIMVKCLWTIWHNTDRLWFMNEKGWKYWNWNVWVTCVERILDFGATIPPTLIKCKHYVRLFYITNIRLYIHHYIILLYKMFVHSTDSCNFYFFFFVHILQTVKYILYRDCNIYKLVRNYGYSNTCYIHFFTVHNMSINLKF